jgi:hypothetical protein
MGSTTVRGAAGGLWVSLRRKLAGWRTTVRTDAALLLLLAAVAVVAFLAHAAYRENLRARWSSVYHDRNSHYQAGLNVACELRNGNVVRAALDLDAGSIVWPPLHPVCLATLLTIAGPSPSVAVIPSLLGWCGATVFAFLLVRRLGGPFGSLGGLVAAALFLGSPALQALGTDVMLESLGLCLTLAALYAYLVFVGTPSRHTGIAFGVSLSLLFLHKYNYWVLVVVALAATECLRRPRELLALLGAAVRAVEWPAWLKAQLRRPLNYPIAALLGISLAAAVNGGIAVDLGAGRFEVRDTRLYVHAAYALLLLRVAAWWWPTGRAATARLCGEPFVVFLTWAAIPVQVWLLLPFRLQKFFWFSSPANTAPELTQTPAEGLRFYLDGFVNEYHVAGPLALAAAMLAVVGVVALACRRGEPGRLAVPLALALSGALAVMHPNHQLRFLHTWAPILWVLAGVGVAALLALLARVVGDNAGRGVGACAVVLLAASLVQLTPGFARVSPAFGPGYDPHAASVRDLHDAYLPLLDGNEPTAVFVNLPEASWRWPFMEHFGHKRDLKHNMREAGVFDPVTRDGAARWLAATGTRTVVYVEIPRTSPLYEPGYPADNSAILAALRAQSVFKVVRRVRVEDRGTVWVWRR